MAENEIPPSPNDGKINPLLKGPWPPPDTQQLPEIVPPVVTVPNQPEPLAAPTQKAPRQGNDGFRELLETIVFVLVLVLVLELFIAESLVTAISLTAH